MKMPDDYTAQRLCMGAAQTVAALLTPGSGFDLDAVNGSARDALCTAHDELLAVGCLAYVPASTHEIPSSSEVFSREGGAGVGGTRIPRPTVGTEGVSLAIAGSPSTRNKKFGVFKK